MGGSSGQGRSASEAGGRITPAGLFPALILADDLGGRRGRRYRAPGPQPPRRGGVAGRPRGRSAFLGEPPKLILADDLGGPTCAPDRGNATIPPIVETGGPTVETGRPPTVETSTP